MTENMLDLVPADLFKNAFDMPKTYPTDALSFEFEVADGIRPLLYEGERYKGRQTKVFAWYGIPKNVSKPCPAVVLVHGGGGTAFADWVHRWNERGFAAISMDLNGSLPLYPWEHAEGYTPFADGARIDRFTFTPQDPVQEQWAFHSIAAIIRANSFLRSFSEIDQERIGITGISWGGWLTSLTVGYDQRFAFAAPVYGCGYLNEGGLTPTVTQLEKLPPELQRKWFDTWNPAVCLARATMPLFMVNDCDDQPYPMVSWLKTYRDAHPLAAFLSPAFGHSHTDGDVPEVLRFARASCGLAAKPPVFSNLRKEADGISADFEGGKAPYSASLIYTTQEFCGSQREWRSLPAAIDGNHISAKLPEGTVYAFLNLTDAEGTVSALPSEAKISG